MKNKTNPQDSESNNNLIRKLEKHLVIKQKRNKKTKELRDEITRLLNKS